MERRRYVPDMTEVDNSPKTIASLVGQPRSSSLRGVRTSSEIYGERGGYRHVFVATSSPSPSPTPRQIGPLRSATLNSQARNNSSRGWICTLILRVVIVVSLISTLILVVVISNDSLKVYYLFAIWNLYYNERLYVDPFWPTFAIKQWPIF